MSLSETQSRAVAHGAGPCICLAGPGSGKTTVITERTKYLIEKQGISPSEILVITFTKAASIEMRERFHNAMKGRYAPVTFGTFHAVFFTILKAAYHYTAENILREEEKYTILRDILEPMDLEIEDEKEFLLGVTEEISLIKNERISLEHYYSSNCPEDVFRSIFREYQQALIRKRKLDFDDMLVCTYELLKARPDICRGWQKRFRYILIDEFQDINAIQYETVKLLAQPGNNLFIVGDDDQSIYRFRGAKPEIMLNFQKDFPKAVMIQLAENYRSTECIIKGAGRVIAHNTNRFQKAHMASAETERRSQSLSFRIRQWRLWRLSKKCRICCETEESHRRSQFCSGRIPEHVFIWKNSWNTTSRSGCGTDCRIFTNTGSQTICLPTYALQTEIAAGKIFCRS